MQFDHEKLEVYQRAIDFLVEADAVVAALPSGRSYLSNQLQRAALSISNNIAEGAGEFSRVEKARFYRMSLRSATECAALLDACRRLKLGGDPHIDSGRALLIRIVSMLTTMVRKLRDGVPATGLDGRD
jgi:four helix bundle protein